ncbi:hypothetical protein NtRootA4_25640 [Arthrobacter sp. NtRootA4]|nr:hypothetical protein NtRootA2_27820 [Arthrobacter sp. NtRootA2]BCW15585.1 hypothetical protein NtRootA4_25640 [Arthrobacter sp. NtRootA4]BCW23919.1 hypothetical protein NtRootC7_27860 [Arthrobacter sp. NtRootC7]BCW28187.1 hypothetical protein NtRootC45_27870 [Arthrobacter sp. NtRootC45]BCW32457.1 hypothetical protein NtRootD5_27880 [Arthrobacter sp. NtRootD5]
MNWDSFEVSEAPGSWALLTETGWHSMLIWAAGPARVVRIPKAQQARYQVEIDDTIDEYIREAAIPPRPRGFDWFLQLPQGMLLEEVDALLNEGVRLGASKAPTSGEVLAVFQHETQQLYPQ